MSDQIGDLDYFLPYQKEWILDEDPFSIGEKSRRIGWTYASSYRAVRRRVRGNRADNTLRNLYFSSADLTAAREFVDYCRTWCEVFNAVAAFAEADETVPVEDARGTVIDERKIHTLNLTFENGTKIVVGSSNPIFFRSKGGDADGDEFAFHRDGRELLKAMHATALFWGHQLRLWSTHNGENSYFNALLGQVRAGQLRARIQTVTILDAVEMGLVEKIKRLKARDDVARKEWLDDLHATVPDEDTWNEEYLCRPSSEVNSLLSYELIRRAVTDNAALTWSPNDLPRTGVFYAGYDVGRRHDLSVLWVIEQVGDVYWTRVLRVLERATFTAQADLINALMANWAVRRICIDENGLGMQLAEQAGERWGSRAEAVKLTLPSKHSLGMALRDVFRDGFVRLPRHVDWDAAEGTGDGADHRARKRSKRENWLEEDLHKTKKSVTAAGNVRLHADTDADGHADGFWAAALAYHAADPLKRPLPKPLASKPVGC